MVAVAAMRIPRVLAVAATVLLLPLSMVPVVVAVAALAWVARLEGRGMEMVVAAAVAALAWVARLEGRGKKMDLW